MPNLDDSLAAKLEKFLNLHKQGILDDAELGVALRGLGLSIEDIQRIERQIIVQGNYFDQRKTAEPPVSSSTLDADTALSRYLNTSLARTIFYNCRGFVHRRAS